MFALSYTLNGIGIADVTAKVGTQAFEMEVSDTSSHDPLGQLAHAALNLAFPNDKEEYYEWSVRSEPPPKYCSGETFRWNGEEGGEWEWHLESAGDGNLRVHIEDLDEEWTHAMKNRSPLDGTCLLTNFVSEIISVIGAMLRTHGIVGYSRLWDTPRLPLAEFIILKRWLAAPECSLEQLNSSGFHEELALLESEGA